jgi:hypothetical protein
VIVPLLQESWLLAIVWLALALVGFLVQLRANRSYEFSREQFRQGWG